MPQRGIIVACLLLAALPGCRHRLKDLANVTDRGVWVATDSLCSDSSPRWLPLHRFSHTLTLAAVNRFPHLRAVGQGRHVPGGWFAGRYRVPNNTPSTIYLRDPSQKVAALSVLDTHRP